MVLGRKIGIRVSKEASWCSMPRKGKQVSGKGFAAHPSHAKPIQCGWLTDSEKVQGLAAEGVSQFKGERHLA